MLGICNPASYGDIRRFTDQYQKLMTKSPIRTILESFGKIGLARGWRKNAAPEGAAQ
jgi:hypothetical protein